MKNEVFFKSQEFLALADDWRLATGDVSILCFLTLLMGHFPA